MVNPNRDDFCKTTAHYSLFIIHYPLSIIHWLPGDCNAAVGCATFVVAHAQEVKP